MNGKDRFFFFVGYQGQRLSQQETTGLGTVFTPAQLSGDFSHSAGSNGFDPNGPDPGVACFLSGLNENAVDSNGNHIPDGTSCGATANTYFQSDATLAAQAIIDKTKLDPIPKSTWL